jgi:hypothetical protein
MDGLKVLGMSALLITTLAVGLHINGVMNLNAEKRSEMNPKQTVVDADGIIYVEPNANVRRDNRVMGGEDSNVLWKVDDDGAYIKLKDGAVVEIMDGGINGDRAQISIDDIEVGKKDLTGGRKDKTGKVSIDLDYISGLAGETKDAK